MNEPITSLTQPEISFELEGENTLAVTIVTERLRIESVSMKHSQDYINLFSDSHVMRMYATGIAWPQDKTATVMDLWLKRWHESIPYSALAISHNLEDTFVGNILLGYGDKPGVSELSYTLKAEQQRKGYGTEAVSCIVNNYASELVQRNYLCQNEPLQAITATCREDNIASYKLLERAGLEVMGKIEKFGATRYQFNKKISDLEKKASLSSQTTRFGLFKQAHIKHGQTKNFSNQKLVADQEIAPTQKCSI